MKKPDIFWSETDGSIPNYPKPKRSKQMTDRERIAIIIEFGDMPQLQVGEGDRKQALKTWGETAGNIITELTKLGYRLPPKLELISHEEVQKARGYVLSNKRALRNIAQAQLAADQKAIEGVKDD